MHRPTFLVSNDDGIDAAFLRRLVRELITIADVYVVAPAGEQSWIGKAMSRYREVAVREVPGYPCPAWSVEGTPADCVNLAVGHLLPRPPDLVVSGINVGFNAGLQLILNSGTVAAALEGALLGYPALALSLHLPSPAFARLKADSGAVEPEIGPTLDAAAAVALPIAETLASGSNPGAEVHNVNFPCPFSADGTVKRCRPSRIHLGSLYRPTSGDKFRFHFQPPEEPPQDFLSDLACLKKGWASHTVLRFGDLG